MLTELRTYVRLLLIEAKVDELKKKHPEMSLQINKLSKSIKPKYLEWAVKQLIAGKDGRFGTEHSLL